MGICHHNNNYEASLLIANIIISSYVGMDLPGAWHQLANMCRHSHDQWLIGKKEVPYHGEAIEPIPPPTLQDKGCIFLTTLGYE